MGLSLKEQKVVSRARWSVDSWITRTIGDTDVVEALRAVSLLGGGCTIPEAIFGRNIAERCAPRLAKFLEEKIHQGEKGRRFLREALKDSSHSGGSRQPGLPIRERQKRDREKLENLLKDGAKPEKRPGSGRTRKKGSRRSSN